MGGLGTALAPTLDVRKAITAMTTVFGVGFCLGWAPLSHVITAELPTNRLRDMTYASASIVNISIQCAVALSLPYLLYAPYAALGARVGFIFGSFATASIVFSWVAIPECRGLSLEEIDHLFINRTSIRRFGDYKAGAVIPRTPEDEKRTTVVKAEENPV